MPVKVEQINEYLFSDTVQSQKTKSGNKRTDRIRHEHRTENSNGSTSDSTYDKLYARWLPRCNTETDSRRKEAM